MQKIFILLTLTILFMASCFDSSENIDIVKNGSFSKYPNVTIGEIASTIFTKVKYKEIIADDGNSYVNLYGYAEEDEVLIQFRIKYRDNLEKYWEVNAMEMNGEPATTRGIANDLYDLYIANK